MQDLGPSPWLYECTYRDHNIVVAFRNFPVIPCLGEEEKWDFDIEGPTGKHFSDTPYPTHEEAMAAAKALVEKQLSNS